MRLVISMMVSSRAASTFCPELAMRWRISSATSMDGIQIAAEIAENSTMISRASPQVGRAAIAANVSRGFHRTAKTRPRLLCVRPPPGLEGSPEGCWRVDVFHGQAGESYSGTDRAEVC